MIKKSRILLILLLCIIQLWLSNSIAFAELPIKVYLNGNQLNFGVDPIMINGSVMVPVRKVFESLNMKVSYDSATRTVFAYGENTAMIIKIDSNKATVMNKETEMPEAAIERNGSTLVPLRFIAEATGAQVEWKDAARKVIIRTVQEKAIEGNPIDVIDISNIKFNN